MINYKPISSECKIQYCAIMATGNVALTKCAEALQFDNTKDFRKFLFRHNFNLVSMSKERKIDQTQRKLLRDEIPKIQAVRTIETEILGAFCNIARKVASKLYKAGTDSLENYEQEGFLALVDAMYGYKHTNIKFTSFLYKAVRNHLLTVIRHDNALSPVSRDAMALKHDFEKMRALINGPCSDEEVFIMLGWNAESRQLYRDATTVPLFASILSENYGDGEEDFDYTQFRIDADNGEPVDFLAIENVMKAMEVANLSAMERLVVETSMEPYYGWQTRLAENNINPETHEPYSRRAIGYMLANAHAKIKAACKLQEAA